MAVPQEWLADSPGTIYRAPTGGRGPLKVAATCRLCGGVWGWLARLVRHWGGPGALVRLGLRRIFLVRSGGGWSLAKWRSGRRGGERGRRGRRRRVPCLWRVRGRVGGARRRGGAGRF